MYGVLLIVFLSYCLRTVSHALLCKDKFVRRICYIDVNLLEILLVKKFVFLETQTVNLKSDSIINLSNLK